MSIQQKNVDKMLLNHIHSSKLLSEESICSHFKTSINVPAKNLQNYYKNFHYGKKSKENQ